ncbi:MAG TPA: DUF1638 domain-containing protein [Bryobacteraceae bacterium]|nr:DUF1638 domain-containing protein [Bryobacteraceae bacterium]
MRLKLISCDVLYREMCAAVARSPHQVDFEFLPKGLHDRDSAEMLAEIQAMVDRVAAPPYDAVVLGYGLCGTGLAGLTARAIPVVLPRAHDCITLFLGSKERYLDYFNNHPGVYFKTTGWIERGEGSEMSQLALRKWGLGMSRAELVAKYGEENADFLAAELENYKVTYSQFTFIEMGVEADDRFERRTQADARERGWKFEKIRGDMSLIESLVNGEWDDGRFLVVNPGWRIAARYDDGIVGVEKAV